MNVKFRLGLNSHPKKILRLPGSPYRAVSFGKSTPVLSADAGAGEGWGGVGGGGERLNQGATDISKVSLRLGGYHGQSLGEYCTG